MILGNTQFIIRAVMFLKSYDSSHHKCVKVTHKKEQLSILAFIENLSILQGKKYTIRYLFMHMSLRSNFLPQKHNFS